MASFESVQRRIDTRFAQAQKNLDEIASNNQTGVEDMRRFFEASRSVTKRGDRNVCDHRASTAQTQPDQKHY